jgi:DNA-directed RNA polymerase specialized sigma24 family protein
MVELQEVLPQEIEVKNFTQLYELAFPVVARFVAKHGGSFEDARDIFQDALIIYHEKKLKGLVLHESETAYIFGISKHLLIRKFNYHHKFISLNQLDRTLEIPDDYFPSMSTSRLLSFLESAGEKCLNLLRAFYFQEEKISAIAKSFKFRSAHSASVQKYKCVEKLRSVIKQKPDLYENLFE